MSDKEPTITVTRGTTRQGPERRFSSADRTNSWSGFSMPHPMDAVSGVMRGVRNAWWAGLGLLSVAESAGSKVFEALVQKGRSWEQVRRERSRATAERVRSLAREVPGVETVAPRVRDEMNALLQRVGAPGRDDFEKLRREVEGLNRKVDQLLHSVEEAEGGSDG